MIPQDHSAKAEETKTWKQLALFLFAVFALFLCGCSSSTLSTKTISGAYNAAPARGNVSQWKLVLNKDYTFLLFTRPPSATAPWKLYKQGSWKVSGRTLKLQTPSKSDDIYQIQGFATSLTSSKKNSPMPSTFTKEGFY